MTATTMIRVRHLQERLASRHVLSVYFSVQAPGSRRRDWRAQVKSQLNARARAIPARSEERKAFTAARRAFESLPLSDASRARGVACFITGDGVLQHIEHLLFPVAVSVNWGVGPALTPWLRVDGRYNTAVMAVLDGQEAKIFLYHYDSLTLSDVVRVHPHLRAPAHLSARPTQGFHPGTRGATGHDEMQREWGAAIDRMTRDVAERAARLAGEDAWVLLGGRTDIVRRTETHLPPAIRRRTGEIHDVSVQSPTHELLHAARESCEALRNAEDDRALHRLEDHGDPRHAAAVGENESRRALDRAAVAELFLSPTFLDGATDRSETAVQSALRQGAEVDVVSGPAAETLDAMGGIAARLRYALA